MLTFYYLRSGRRLFVLLFHYLCFSVSSWSLLTWPRSLFVIGFPCRLPLYVAALVHDFTMLAIAPLGLTMDSGNVSRAPRVGHKKSRKGCAQCKRRHVKVRGSPRLNNHRKRRTMLTAARFRSAMKKHRARTAYDTASRARSPGGQTSQEMMRSPNNEVPRRRCRVCRRGRHHMTPRRRARPLLRLRHRRAWELAR